MDHFEDLEDPRGLQGRLHRLEDILVIALLAVICGADDWSEVAEFGEAKESWLRTFLALPHGIPSHDTFGRVFAALDASALERCFGSWMRALAEASPAGLVAIDGKSLRRSFDQASGKSAVHMVSAWASDTGVVLGQLACEAKSNEITAIPGLLELLNLRGATVTIDAEGCQREIARKITEGAGEYVLGLKANQPTMHEEVRFFLDDAIAQDFKCMAHDQHEEVDGDHGRIEIRRAWCTSEVDWFEDRHDWAGLRCFAAVECERTVGEHTSRERRYFISSLPGTDAAAIARAVRQHWRIENSLHWCLDVSFAEDQRRTRTGFSAENFSRLCRFALNLIRNDPTRKVGIKAKRRRAGWDHDYLLKLLTN